MRPTPIAKMYNRCRQYNLFTFFNKVFSIVSNQYWNNFFAARNIMISLSAASFMLTISISLLLLHPHWSNAQSIARTLHQCLKLLLSFGSRWILIGARFSIATQFSLCMMWNYRVNPHPTLFSVQWIASMTEYIGAQKSSEMLVPKASIVNRSTNGSLE